MVKSPKQKQLKKISQNNKKNYDWFIRADVSNYAGKWIAVQNQKIVASGNNISQLLEQTQKNWPEASITKIPKRGQIMVL